MFRQIKIKPEERLKKLKEIMNRKKLIRVIEAHNGISALVASNSGIEVSNNWEREKLEFDALWASSFTDSASKGFPDIEIVSLDSRVDTIEQIINVSDKPIIVDGDTGRDIDSFLYFISNLERLGVSAVIIEDKIGPKRNSLFGVSVKQTQDSIDNFCQKINKCEFILNFSIKHFHLHFIVILPLKSASILFLDSFFNVLYRSLAQA